MSDEIPFELDATDWILPATRGSKYAHAPNWSVFAFSRPQTRPACTTQLPSWDGIGIDNSHAEGKPPCPRCLSALRHHLKWLTAWTDAYEAMDWEKA